MSESEWERGGARHRHTSSSRCPLLEVLTSGDQPGRVGYQSPVHRPSAALFASPHPAHHTPAPCISRPCHFCPAAVVSVTVPTHTHDTISLSHEVVHLALSKIVLLSVYSSILSVAVGITEAINSPPFVFAIRSFFGS